MAGSNKDEPSGGAKPESALSRPIGRPGDDAWRQMTPEERHIVFLEGEIARLEARLPTAKEMGELREIISSDMKAKWLWASIRTWALWISAVVLGITVGLDALKSLLRRLIDQ